MSLIQFYTHVLTFRMNTSSNEPISNHILYLTQHVNLQHHFAECRRPFLRLLKTWKYFAVTSYVTSKYFAVTLFIRF